ncbi:uncharacterized protein BX663DRAFT_514702 [Cokeromyces recurvatus]|uniref:uncharacterized protein n=1 Tax=Cokeromyces recurvatus TaxID=90255 RepID=UPI00221F695B|nr:uncharacterized protein BX663DRAFT_514702 [Cokeromyces recurvatus]KAI7901520.1 hypothetical protein BX663DRAFT_514702 [Cokeromyces recurvatus]
MFQFINDWKRKRGSSVNSTHVPTCKDSLRHEEEITSNEATTTNVLMCRSSSMDSDNKSFASISSIMDWNQPKDSFTFKDDYVSFPSLEPEVSCYYKLFLHFLLSCKYLL